MITFVKPTTPSPEQLLKYEMEKASNTQKVLAVALELDCKRIGIGTCNIGFAAYGDFILHPDRDMIYANGYSYDGWFKAWEIVHTAKVGNFRGYSHMAPYIKPLFKGIYRYEDGEWRKE